MHVVAGLVTAMTDGRGSWAELHGQRVQWLCSMLQQQRGDGSDYEFRLQIDEVTAVEHQWRCTTCTTVDHATHSSPAGTLVPSIGAGERH